MPTLSPSLFIKEPGKTKNLILESPGLKKESKSLKPGDVLEVKEGGGKTALYDRKTHHLIGEIEDEKINKKVSFTLLSKGEIIVIFVCFLKGGKSTSPAAQFLIKSSLPVFPEEASADTLRPFTRSGEIPQDADEAEETTSVVPDDANDETTLREETDPLAGLTVINKEDLAETDEP